jgi:surface carbohydrate biosynthesis protein
VRKLEGIVKKKYDVVVIDDTDTQWLDYCIPKKCTSFAIKIDNALPFVKSLSFLYNLFGSLVRNGLTSTSLLSAIILELKPKVVITFIDNNRFMGPLQIIFPDILVISVQNGVRIDDPYFESRKGWLSYPHYFGFGSHELNVMKSKEANVKKYYPVGSLKMGIFISSIYKPMQKSKITKNICFISEYADVEANAVGVLYAKRILAYQTTYRLLARFSQENNININVAIRSEFGTKEHQNELDFFENIFSCSNVTYYANDKANMSSYQLGMDSDLVVSFDSTLLFELFGAGKKILCGGCADRDIVNMQNSKNQYEFMPSETLLDSWDYDEFKEKINVLLRMDNNDFQNKAKSARKYYMNLGDECPHQAIYSSIQRKCN